MQPTSKKSYLSFVILIIANLVPIYGVIFFGWDTLTILLLYLLESFIIGFLNFLNTDIQETELVLGYYLFAGVLFFTSYLLILMLLEMFFGTFVLESNSSVKSIASTIKIPLAFFVFSNFLAFLLREKEPKTIVRNFLEPFFLQLVRISIIFLTIIFSAVVIELLFQYHSLKIEAFAGAAIALILTKTIIEAVIHLKKNKLATSQIIGEVLFTIGIQLLIFLFILTLILVVGYLMLGEDYNSIFVKIALVVAFFVSLQISLAGLKSITPSFDKFKQKTVRNLIIGILASQSLTILLSLALLNGLTDINNLWQSALLIIVSYFYLRFIFKKSRSSL